MSSVTEGLLASPLAKELLFFFKLNFSTSLRIAQNNREKRWRSSRIHANVENQNNRM
jgi:hypothetical protein